MSFESRPDFEYLKSERMPVLVIVLGVVANDKNDSWNVVQKKVQFFFALDCEQPLGVVIPFDVFRLTFRASLLNSSDRSIAVPTLVKLVYPGT